MNISVGTKNIQNYYNWLQENIFKGQAKAFFASKFKPYCALFWGFWGQHYCTFAFCKFLMFSVFGVLNNTNCLTLC